MTPNQKSLKAQQESFREEVIQNELIARANKAEYERMYYFLESTKIVKEYLAAVEARQAELNALNGNIVEQIETQVKEQNSEVEMPIKMPTEETVSLN